MTQPQDDPSTLHYVAGIDRQSGALAWQDVDGVRKFWLVTSRRTQRWVLPKGSIDPGMTAPEAAAQEAFEEAGLLGEMSEAAVGSYCVPKIRPPLIWAVEVFLFPMRVAEVQPEWLEQDQRVRRLVSIDEAADLILEPEIVDLVMGALPDLHSASYQ